MELSIIIPVKNEELNIKFTLLSLKEILKDNYEIIVVNDYSSDGTVETVKVMSHNFPQLRWLDNPDKRGFANSLMAGINMAQGDVVIPVMADLCDEIKIIPQMYEKILEGCDIVCASRYIKDGERQGGPILKAFLSRYASWMIHKISKIPATDLANPFRAYRKIVLEDFPIKSMGFEISMEIVLKAYLKGYKITEIPTKWRERSRGKSNFSIISDTIKFIKWFLYGLCIPCLPKGRKGAH